MNPTLILLAAALGLRFGGAVLRHDDSRWSPSRFLGWEFCVMAVWIGLAAVGSWFPAWPVAAIGAIGWLLTARWNHPLLRTGTDLLMAVVVGTLSMPALSSGVLAGAAVCAVVVGFVFDRLAIMMIRHLSPAMRWTIRWGIVAVAAVPIGMVGWKALAWRASNPVDTVLHDFGVLPNLVIATRPHPTKVELSTGAIAWLERPNHVRPVRTAVFFHGAERRGANQRPACVFRRALLDAHYAVLSVDHPGYGASPAPSDAREATAWDPLPTVLAAIESARHLTGVEDIILVGHSMGTSDVLRALSHSVKVEATVVFGGALTSPLVPEEYRYTRFHRDRRLQQKLPAELVREIRSRYYDNDRLVEQQPGDHPEILFVRFGIENAPTESTRDQFFASLPGRKSEYDLPGVDHYLNSLEVWGFLIADNRAGSACRRLFAGLQNSPRHAAEMAHSGN